MSYLRGLSVLEAFADAEDEVVVKGKVGEPHVDHVGHRINGFDIVICSAGSKKGGNVFNLQEISSTLTNATGKIRQNKTQKNLSKNFTSTLTSKTQTVSRKSKKNKSFKAFPPKESQVSVALKVTEKIFT